MKPIIIIVITIIVSVVVLWAVFGQEFSDSEGLQNAIDACTKEIDNMETTGRDLESCLDDAYNQHGSTEEKQSWFDDEHQDKD
ncbi:hypothetical protein [Nitrosopumilus ureiphilus]|uniref:Uncharacterized protein n=1 Tax=Nitrosopumilus ureiphilus TaxID=1470067 RepID=A0A7D5M7B1_9ARCH|nr:hypothetical protein [Nitrosopumilus ureiphilus]QLH06230.1 hypothetical protein C5F50_03420 [Nitrosopumilus ureiphilus]